MKSLLRALSLSAFTSLARYRRDIDPSDYYVRSAIAISIQCTSGLLRSRYEPQDNRRCEPERMYKRVANNLYFRQALLGSLHRRSVYARNNTMRGRVHVSTFRSSSRILNIPITGSLFHFPSDHNRDTSASGCGPLSPRRRDVFFSRMFSHAGIHFRGGAKSGFRLRSGSQLAAARRGLSLFRARRAYASVAALPRGNRAASRSRIGSRRF